MKVLLIDNFDSFTYNLFHLLEPHAHVEVVRYDKFKVGEVSHFNKVVISPGPETPASYPKLFDMLKAWESKKEILGVCLGMQAIAQFYGASLINLPHVFHGVGRGVNVVSNDQVLFRGLPVRFISGRYHSWAVDADSIPQSIEITSFDDQGIVMSLKHKKFNVRGVQFHPESIITEYGADILFNWVSE